MLRSLFSAVSGLRNLQTGMDVIGNNIANVNTTAFKSGRAEYQDSFSQILSGASRPTDSQGGVNPIGVGLGMKLGAVDTILTQGNLQSTGVATDLAIQGGSYFVVGQGNQTFYTRAGAFKLDANGNLNEPTSGFTVQGRMATNGVLSGALQNIVIPTGMTTPAKVTTSITISGNFDSSAPTITAANTASPTATELADPANAQSVVQMPIGAFDSLGAQHDVTVVAWKVSPTQWDFKIDPTSLNYDSTKPYTLGPGASSSPAAAATPWQFTFKADGTLDATASNIPPITFSPVTGSALTIALKPGTGGTGMTSYVADSSAVLRDQNGYASGVLEHITVDQNGTISGAFTNGTNQTLAQVALADFNNPEGLSAMGGNMYAISSNSGSPLIGFSGKETSSTIASGSLEMSNVDLSQEFTNMIITQRGFQANAKMITTSDQMLQELVNLKQ